MKAKSWCPCSSLGQDVIPWIMLIYVGAVATGPKYAPQGWLRHQHTVKVNRSQLGVDEELFFLSGAKDSSRDRAFAEIAHATGTTNLGLGHDDFLGFQEDG